MHKLITAIAWIVGICVGTWVVGFLVWLILGTIGFMILALISGTFQ